MNRSNSVTWVMYVTVALKYCKHAKATFVTNCRKVPYGTGTYGTGTYLFFNPCAIIFFLSAEMGIWIENPDPDSHQNALDPQIQYGAP